MTDLITVLHAQQEALAESDAAFARRIGLDRTTWGKLRRRQFQMGRKHLARILKAQPTLADVVLADLGKSA